MFSRLTRGIKGAEHFMVFNRHFILGRGQSLSVLFKSRVTFAFPGGLPSGKVQIERFALSMCVYPILLFLMSASAYTQCRSIFLISIFNYFFLDEHPRSVDRRKRTYGVFFN